MKIAVFFIRLHLKRWYRFLNELGPIRSVLIFIVAFALLRYGFQQFAAGVEHWAYLSILIIQVIQYQRKDYKLLKIAHFNDYVLYCILYLVLLLPSIVAFGITMNLTGIGISLGAAFLTPLFNSKSFNMDKFFISVGDFLPYKYFEWRTGLRQYGLAVIILTLAGLGLSIFQGGVPLIIFFLTLNTSVFYLFGESKELLVANAQSAYELIINKIKGHLLIFFTLIAPMAVLYLIFNLQLWYVLVYVCVIAFLASINAILFKYAAYQPGERFDNNNVLQGLMLVFFLIPFLFPIPIIMMIVNYRKSVKNLQPYFGHDN